MNTNDTNAKDRIIKATMDILDEVGEPEKITIRQIAERANVGVGLINYHFQTKENLLYMAVSETMSRMAVEFQKLNNHKDKEPVQRLKTMLKGLCDFTLRYNKLSFMLASHDLLHGDMQTPLYLMPILREIYGEAKDEIEIRLIALEIIATFQVTYIRSQAFQLYIGIDINDKAQRDKLIDTIINNMINK